MSTTAPDTVVLSLGADVRRHVNNIAGRLSLRVPQKQALEILARVCEIVPPRQGAVPDASAALAAVRSEFPQVRDFEREFPSLCFELATGVGKTRLMGAFITYLYRAHGLRDFFVLAPNLTIYRKLIADFTPNTAKYVFQGIAEFAVSPPQVITGDNYASVRSLRPPTHGLQDVLPGLEANARINIFNISKLFSTTKDDKAQGREARIKRLNEALGRSYFEYLASLENLIVLMDESHRYRADASARAIGELRPVLGLELTATPQVESGGRTGAKRFENVIYSYRLGNAIHDGLVKRPAVATRANFQAAEYGAERLDLIKLTDGLALHELTKVELATYASRTQRPLVKPFVLVIAADTQHAAQLKAQLESVDFFDGRYRGRVIEVHSGQRGAESDENVEKLLTLESLDNEVEIVVHVNMLKEGWDVTNLYTIIPLRAAHSRTLVEQSIGRGLRLPYGARVGVDAVDTVTIVAHEHFQAIIDDAQRADSPLRELGTIVIDETLPLAGQRVVTAEPASTQQVLDVLEPPSTTPSASPMAGSTAPSPPSPESAIRRDIHVATLTQIHGALARGDVTISHTAGERHVHLSPQFEHAVMQSLPVRPAELTPDLEAARVEMRRAAEALMERLIEVPRITVTPRGEVTVGYKDFDLELDRVRLQPVDDDILVRSLVDTYSRRVRRQGTPSAERLEDMIVFAVTEYEDIDYRSNAALLYKLAGQMVDHLRGYLPDDEAVRNVLLYHQRVVAEHIHTALVAHRWERADEYDVKVTPGTLTLRPLALSANEGDTDRPFRHPVDNRQDIRHMVFVGFKKCLYDRQKFDSDTERVLACVLEDDPDVLKWVKPARGQFVIDYADGHQYEPDFVVETRTEQYLVEPKARGDMNDAVVQAKKRAAETWCAHATRDATLRGTKPWKYVLVPHDEISTSMTLRGLAARWG
ncbi:DEAD/DEAH box helicase family protein [Myxococcota bacterium]|nr:DEAD/DEAH box helicase family protein [Myxococcota bacterium]